MTTFFISDTHFHHRNILKVRPGFASIEEMNAELVKRWNAVVRPSDRVYHLGDVSMWNVHSLQIVRELNGHKFLILGNHDNLHLSAYLGVGFEKLYAGKEFKGFVATHVPLHPSELYRWGANVHGHIHDSRHLDDDGRYLCVSVERTDYTPVSLEEVRERIASNQQRIKDENAAIDQRWYDENIGQVLHISAPRFGVSDDLPDDHD